MECSDLKITKLIEHISIPSIVEMRENNISKEEAIPKLLNSLFDNSGLTAIIDDKAKQEIFTYLNKMGNNDFKEFSLSNYMLLRDFMLKKTGVPFFTHYDLYKLNSFDTKEAQNFFKEFIQNLPSKK